MSEGYDEALEAEIDRAGRERVFARARELGWQPGSTPPKWVWRCIANDLRFATSVPDPSNKGDQR